MTGKRSIPIEGSDSGSPASSSQKQKDDLRESAATLNKTLISLQNDISAMCSTFQACSRSFVAFRDHADGVNLEPGLKALCSLYRDLALSQTDSPELNYAVRQLGIILTDKFGLVEVHPEPGEPYRQEIADRLRADMPLSTVHFCAASGWYYHEEILQRAVVATAEPDAPESKEIKNG